MASAELTSAELLKISRLLKISHGIDDRAMAVNSSAKSFGVRDVQHQGDLIIDDQSDYVNRSLSL
jgi:hypothetical protein